MHIDPVPRLEIRHASKTFGRAKVLDDVTLTIAPGEVHGLVGQNGSGKSTLIKLLSGFYTSDEGTQIVADGGVIPQPISPHSLRDRGIAFVHQNLGLDLEANAIENVRIGRFDVHPLTRRIRWKEEADAVVRSLETLGVTDLNPYLPVGALTHAQRASVAIARALQSAEAGTGCIVFDESTQSLPREILHQFYAQVRRLSASGTAILLVSHRIDEVLALCDTVTVLEDGRASISDHSTEGTTEAELTAVILGSSKARSSRPARLRSSGVGDVALAVDALSGRTIRNLSFDARAGEVVGIIGPSDSGYDELPYLISGARPATGGTVVVGGRTLDARRVSPTSAIGAGIGMIPGERLGQGLAADIEALENLTLPRVGRRSSPWVLRRRWQTDEFAEAVGAFGLTPSAPDLVTAAYSGGNQQKLLLAKWLLNHPKVLVVHEPTQAVDVGARADILAALRAEADSGTAVVIVSLETDDLASVCDRILIVKGGTVTRQLTGDEIEPHHIIDAAYTGVSSEIENAAA